MWTVVAGITLAVMAGGCAQVAQADAGRSAGQCFRNTRTAALDSGLSGTEIRDISVTERLAPGDDEDLPAADGYRGWVTPRGCDGYFVVDMNGGCAVESVYTQGECQISGVEHYATPF
jgi:hypothetical protein